MLPKRDDIIQHVSNAVFGQPLVNNVFRSLIVEAMVDMALDNDWEWCSADWAACDFKHADGTRLEVKQSAAKQSWSKPGSRPAKAVFDIAPRTGYWKEAGEWIACPGRNADLYIFAHHPGTNAATDHMNPDQWDFCIVATGHLPAAKTISISRVQKLAKPVGISAVQDVANAARRNLGGL